jgi:hypothetical protein
MGQEKGVLFYGGVSPSKISLIAPYLDTVQALSKARVFLWAAPTGLRGVPSEKIALNSLRGAFTVEESNPARILARTTERIFFSSIKNER